MDKYFACLGLPGSFVLTTGLSLYALVLAIVSGTPARWLCCLAMALSSIGDIFLMRFRGLDRIFPNYFTWGACAFMLAHVAYTASFALRIRESGTAYMNPGMWMAVVMAAGCLVYLTVNCRDRSQYLLCAVYGVIIAVNCMTVFSYAWGSWRAHPMAIISAIGALSFFLSDMIIGLGMLTRQTQYDPLIWWLYPIGQFLLITGAGM